MANKDFYDYKYLIIGGAPKSATTSLFRYLSDHPQICPTNRKETYFFAREFDYKNICQCDETIDSFEKFYKNSDCAGNWRLEGTPYTLYAEDAAQRISTFLPDARLIFILRDPVARLYSDFRFHIQRNHPHVRGPFEEFVQEQFKISGKQPIPSLLELGCYITYLRSFFEVFGKEKISVIFFKDLMSEPEKEIQKLCLATGIDPQFYSNYDFSVHNQTINVRFNWLNRVSIGIEPLIANLRIRLMSKPKLYQVFEKTINSSKSFYYHINNQNSKKREHPPTEIFKELRDYYRPYNQALAQELGRQLPWQM